MFSALSMLDRESSIVVSRGFAFVCHKRLEIVVNEIDGKRKRSKLTMIGIGVSAILISILILWFIMSMIMMISIALKSRDIQQKSLNESNPVPIVYNTDTHVVLKSNENTRMFKFILNGPTVLKLKIENLYDSLGELNVCYYESHGSGIGDDSYFTSDTTIGLIIPTSGEYYIRFHSYFDNDSIGSDLSFQFRVTEYSQDIEEYWLTCMGADIWAIPFVPSAKYPKIISIKSQSSTRIE